MIRIACLSFCIIFYSSVFGQGGYGTIRIQKSAEDTVVGMIAPIALEKGLKQRTTISISDKFELKKIVVERVFYNSEGYLTEIRDYFRNIRTRFEYDTSGRVTSIELTNSVLDQLIYVDLFSYPSSGQMLQYRISINALKLDAKPDTLFKKISLFDEKGNKLEEKKWERGGFERTVLTYDSLRRISRELVFMPAFTDSLRRSVSYKYTESGKEVLTEEPRIKKGQITLQTKKQICFYDEMGNTEKEETWKGTVLVVSKNYTFNEKGKPVEMRSFETDAAGVNYSHHLYEYSFY